MLFSSTSDQLAPSTISILGTTGEDNTPDDSNVLWTEDYPDGFGTDWYDIDLSASPPALTKDTVYAIALYTTDSALGAPDVAWMLDREQNLYANGKMWENRGSGWVTLTVSSVEKPNADAAFKTYITIPEPATVVLLSIGLFLIGARKALRYSF